MSSLEKYIKAFTQTFEIMAEETTGLEYQSIEVWDSVGHMGLVAASKYYRFLKLIFL